MAVKAVPAPVVEARAGALQREIATRDRLDRQLFDRLADGDRRAREELVLRFMPLSRALALRYQRGSDSPEDLMPVAALALAKAIDGYDPARGCAFSRYAVSTIAGELKRHVRDTTWAVRVPRGRQQRALLVDRTIGALAARSPRQPSIAQIAAHAGLGEEDVLEAIQTSATAFSALPRDVLRMRFEQDMTDAQIGAAIGVSQMQVSRIVRGALARLRDVSDRPAAAATRAGEIVP